MSREIIGLGGTTVLKELIITRKKFEIAKSDFVRKNFSSKVKEFVTEMKIKIAYFLFIFLIRIASFVISR